jgi:nucleotide-binding universal stress UspA family protein
MDKQKIADTAEVVVGTDGTDIAFQAVAWAATEARLRGVLLRIVHAAPYMIPANDAGRRRAAAILRRAYTVAHQHEPHVPTHTQRIDAEPVRALVDTSSNAEMLVVGLRRQRLDEVIIGSVALAVSGAARCPVTVVRAQRSSAYLVGPVLLGVEDVAVDAPAVTVAFADAQRRQTRLIALHTQRDSLQERTTGRGAQTAAEDALTEQLAPWRSCYPKVPVEVRVMHGEPGTELLLAADTASLVVVGSHGRSAPARLLLGSTSRLVVKRSPCPVTVVRWDTVVGDIPPRPSASTTSQTGAVSWSVQN